MEGQPLNNVGFKRPTRGLTLALNEISEQFEICFISETGLTIYNIINFSINKLLESEF